MTLSGTVVNDKINDEIIKESKGVNFTGWYTATLLTQSGGAVSEPYLPLFAQSIGATNSQIGLLTGLYSLVNISQLVWAQLSVKFGHNKLFVYFGQLLTALMFIPMAFIKIGYFFILLLERFFQGLFNSATIPSLASLKSDFISDQDRASKITKFTYLGLTGSFIGTLLGGFFFDYLNTKLTSLETFSLMFIFTALIGLAGSVIFFYSVPSITKLPPLKETLSPISFIDRDLSHQKSKIKFTMKVKNYIKKFRSFWLFTAFGIIFYFGVYTVSPFFIILEVNYFEFSYLQASLLTALSVIIQVSVSILLVRKNLMNKYGRKPFLIIGMILILFFTFLIAFPYYFVNYLSIDMRFYICILSWIVLGLGWGLFNSAIAVLLLDIAHPQYRSLLIAVFNSLTGIAMFAGPIVGGVLIDYTNNFFVPFILRLIVIAVAIVFFKVVKEPEISGIELKPIRNVFPFFTRMTTARGPELGIAYGNEKLARKKHL